MLLLTDEAVIADPANVHTDPAHVPFRVKGHAGAEPRGRGALVATSDSCSARKQASEPGRTSAGARLRVRPDPRVGLPGLARLLFFAHRRGPGDRNGDDSIATSGLFLSRHRLLLSAPSKSAGQSAASATKHGRSRGDQALPGRFQGRCDGAGSGHQIEDRGVPQPPSGDALNAQA
jgi:hypothetical protein